jgi:uncharacterized membrane protein
LKSGKAVVPDKKIYSVFARRLHNLVNLKFGFLLSILAIGVIYSSIIPPLQSPDEYVHLSRAYLFSKGKIILDAPPDSNSGGLIDDGLLEYIKIFSPISGNPHMTVSRHEIDSSKDIAWTGKRTFADAAGGAYYFPAIYAPHALGLFVGEKLSLTVDQSYRLARFFAFGLSVLIILFAFKIFPTNWFVASLLILPMSVFQIVSASIDGLTTALSILCVSLFMRGMNKECEFPRWMPYVLAIVIFIIATSRIHLLPFIGFLFFIYLVRRCNVSLWASVVVAVLSVAWLIIAVKTTSDLRIERAFTTSYVIGYYLMHPSVFFQVLVATISDANLVNFYKESFVGLLGWLDTRFQVWFYKISIFALVATAMLSITLRSIRADYLSRIMLLLIATASTLLIFFALLVTWTPHPASIVSGVQGRYFIVPIILLGYALSGNNNLLRNKRSFLSFLLLVLYGFLVCFLMPQLLINRYYSISNVDPDVKLLMKPSAPLAQDSAIPLYLAPAYDKDSVGLKTIQLMLGTYSRKNTGEAELQLYKKDGQTITRRFSLLALKDNRYFEFELDSNQYTNGKIISVSGIGISAWEVHDNQGNIQTCAVYKYSNGRKQRTLGCPDE